MGRAERDAIRQIQPLARQAGRAGHAIGADDAAVHQPPGIPAAAAFNHDAALAQKERFIAGLGGDAVLHGNGQLQRRGAGLLARVQMKSAQRLQHAWGRRGQAGHALQ
ncbi:MAG: hypothetical protein FWD77_09715, partial [Betaproteobacteria bacterium]|nr:hypothetical protein [Betaproteobacteria bacterium]